MSAIIIGLVVISAVVLVSQIVCFATYKGEK